MRRHSRRWPWALLLVPVAAAGLYQLQRSRQPSAAMAAPPPPPGSPAPTATVAATTSTLVAFGAPAGERSTGPRCVMVVLDESTSMSTADAAGTRTDAVRAAADFLSAHGIDGDRIGVAWFADAAEVVDPAPPAQASAARPGAVYLGSGTQVAAALTRTLGSMQASCDGAQPVIVLVSDGQASGAREFDAIRETLAGAPALNVHLIAMNGGQAFEVARAFWEDPRLGIDSIATISDFGRDEVAAAMAGILSRETGQQVTAS